MILAFSCEFYGRREISSPIFDFQNLKAYINKAKIPGIDFLSNQNSEELLSQEFSSKKTHFEDAVDDDIMPKLVFPPLLALPLI